MNFKKKYTLKLLSILPHFLFIRITKKLFQTNNVSTIQILESIKFYNTQNPPLDKVLYDRYFDNRIPALGVAVEYCAFDGAKESSCLFFEESLGWHVFNIESSLSDFKKLEMKRPISRNFNFELSEVDNQDKSITFSSFFELAQLEHIDLFILNNKVNEINAIKQLKNSSIRPIVFCIEKQHLQNWEEIYKILTNLNYIYDTDIHNYGVFVQSESLKKYSAKLEGVKKSENIHKPKVNIISNIFQNSQYIETFFDQIKNLHQKNFELGTVFVSTNGPELTNKRFKELSESMPFKVEIGFDPNIEIDEFSMYERARKWTSIFNAGIKKSLEIDSEFTLIFEADLTYPPDIVDYLVEADVDVVAPVIFCGKNFYDSWGYRKLNGEKIYDLEHLNTPIFESVYNDKFLTELSSVGSYLCIKTKYLRKSIRLPADYENGHLVGLNKNIRKFKGRVFCRTDISIIHPTSYWENQLWNSEIKIMEKHKESEKIIEIENFKHKLPGFEDVFIKPYIKKFHKNSDCFYIVTKYKNKKIFIIYCFNSESVMEEYLTTFNNRTDIEIKTFYFNSKEYITQNDNFILDR